jgi:dGTPase
MITRQHLEKLEKQNLAPYAAKSGESEGRRYPEKEHTYRTAFQRDRDRVVHSSAFRRLKHKTQVYIAHEGDYFRTRLTHTMEACQIARTISRVLNLNEDLTETLAICHDLGHPPFGHAGEDALQECMKKLGGFEHNIQGIRVVTLLEHRYPDFPGLNLTFETLESMRKHTIKPDKPVEQDYKPHYSPLLECYVVDISDSIAYNAHDIDDAIKAGVIKLADLESTAIGAKAIGRVRKSYKTLDGELLTRHVVRVIIDLMVGDVISNTEKNIERLGINDLEGVRTCKERAVTFSPEIGKSVEQLHKFLYDNVYRNYRVARMAIKAKRFLTEIFNAYMEDPAQLPPQFQSWAKQVGLERAICDYIAGMTDKFAQEEYKRLFYPFELLL